MTRTYGAFVLVTCVLLLVACTDRRGLVATPLAATPLPVTLRDSTVVTPLEAQIERPATPTVPVQSQAEALDPRQLNVDAESYVGRNIVLTGTVVRVEDGSGDVFGLARDSYTWASFVADIPGRPDLYGENVVAYFFPKDSRILRGNTYRLWAIVRGNVSVTLLLSGASDQRAGIEVYAVHELDAPSSPPTATSFPRGVSPWTNGGVPTWPANVAGLPPTPVVPMARATPTIAQTDARASPVPIAGFNPLLLTTTLVRVGWVCVTPAARTTLAGVPFVQWDCTKVISASGLTARLEAFGPDLAHVEGYAVTFDGKGAIDIAAVRGALVPVLSVPYDGQNGGALNDWLAVQMPLATRFADCPTTINGAARFQLCGDASGRILSVSGR